jgi:hypothetical protein
MRTTTLPSSSTTATPTEPDAAQLLIAERAVAAFISAVNEVLGPDHAYEAAEFWIEQLNIMDWLASDELPDWRYITKEAAARLASNTQISSMNPRPTTSQ